MVIVVIKIMVTDLNDADGNDFMMWKELIAWWLVNCSTAWYQWLEDGQQLEFQFVHLNMIKYWFESLSTETESESGKRLVNQE